MRLKVKNPSSIEKVATLTGHASRDGSGDGAGGAQVPPTARNSIETRGRKRRKKRKKEGREKRRGARRRRRRREMKTLDYRSCVRHYVRARLIEPMRSIYNYNLEVQFSFVALAQHVSTPLDRGTAAAVRQSCRWTTSVGSSVSRSLHHRPEMTMRLIGRADNDGTTWVDDGEMSIVFSRCNAEA
jgi:hypothetical protein